MKPRWTIFEAVPVVGAVHKGAQWMWVRADRNGRRSVVGCVCHHTWTKRVTSFEVIP